jgi:3-hydroxyacyl-CoA dehydrogenase
VFRDLFHYSAYHLSDIAETARDIDLAIRWGYGWSLGPFETWQAAGWKQVADWIAEDIVGGKAMGNAPLPDWVFDGRDGVHGPAGSFSPARNAVVPRSTNPVYARQRFPDPVLGEKFSQGRTVFENDGVRMWVDEGDDIAVVGFKTKLQTVNDHVLTGLQQAIDIAERDFRGLVIWQPKEPFSAGADLAGALGLLQAGDVAGFEGMVANFQATSQRIKYALVPVVAAVRGLALGGGCEFQMHAAHTVFGLESYVGLVEAGVGLLPAGGGLKELAVRASDAAGPGGDVFAQLKTAFETVAMAKVSTSALEAKQLKLARDTDSVVFNSHELLHVARTQARAMAESGYRPPMPARRIQVAGDVGIATFKMMLVNMLEGRFISQHDYDIATRIATVLCGGNIDRGSLVDEAWLLRLEREHFVALAQMPKTQERIAHMLKTGKPLRN